MVFSYIFFLKKKRPIREEGGHWYLLSYKLVGERVYLSACKRRGVWLSPAVAGIIEACNNRSLLMRQYKRKEF
jgi:hypothetical protein